MVEHTGGAEWWGDLGLSFGQYTQNWPRCFPSRPES